MSREESREIDPKLRELFQRVADDNSVPSFLKIMGMILAGEIDTKSKAWDWRDVEWLEIYGLVEIEKDADFSVEIGDDGKPYHEGGEFPVDVRIIDRLRLEELRAYVEERLARVTTATEALYEKRKEWVWRCPKCKHFMLSFPKRKKLENLLLKESQTEICKKCRTRSVAWVFSDTRVLKVLQVIRDDLSEAP